QEEQATLQDETVRLRREAAELGQERDRLAARCHEVEERLRVEVDRLSQALQQSQQQEQAAVGARDELTRQVEAYRTELDKDRRAEEARRADAAVWAAWGGQKSPDEVDPRMARIWQQQLEAARQVFARERAVWLAEMNRLRQENNQLRQWLSKQGVQ